MTAFDIILLILLIAVVIATAVVSIKLFTNTRDLTEYSHSLEEYVDYLSKEKRDVLLDKVSLEAMNDDLREENVRLSAAVSELRAKLDETEKKAEPEPEITPKERLPEGRTNVISGMPFMSITNKKSEQWALQLQAFTGEYGIRGYFDGERVYFLAAMGSAYGREIGTAFRVTLKCGTEMYVMLGEFKDDGTDPNFFGHPTKHADGYDVTCVLEFIYDAEKIDSRALQAGNFCNIEYFGGLHGDGGDIARIEYLGRKWEP